MSLVDLAGGGHGTAAGAPPANTGEIVRIELDKIGGDQDIRADRLNLDHVEAMRPFVDSLPPVTLRPHKRDGHYEIIDGSHRVSAHRRENRAVIDAIVLELDDASAIEVGTKANIAHGRPLVVEDRRRNARRLIAAAPDWSDRRIAESCGLAHATVAGLRPVEGSGGQSDHLNRPAPKRTGGDGKSYPTPDAAAANRASAEKIVEENPDVTVSELAEKSGVSKGTASGIKNGKTRGHLRDVSATDEERSEVTVADVVVPLPSSWVKTPAAKRSNDGAEFCAWMDRRTIRGSDPDQMVQTYARKVPGELFAQAEAAARVQAGLWADFADAVSARRQEATR